MSPGPLSPTPQGQVAGDSSADWQAAVESVKIDSDGLRDVYVSAMEEGKYDSAELGEVHSFAEKAEEGVNPRWVGPGR